MDNNTQEQPAAQTAQQVVITKMEVPASSSQEVTVVTRISELKAAAKRAEINDDDTYSKGLDLIKIIKVAANKGEEIRKSLVGPANELVKSINARFKTTVTEPLAAAEKEINDKLTKYAVEKANREREEKAALARQQEEAALAAAAAQEAAGDNEAAEKTIAVAEKATDKMMAKAGKASGVGGYTGAKGSLGKVWKYEVVDIVALATARPDLVEVKAGEFRSVMNELIRTEQIKADAIPGIVFRQEDQLNVR